MKLPPYEHVMPVEIVRPVRQGFWENAIGAGAFWLRSFAVMLLIPYVFPSVHWSYWQAMAAVVIVANLLPSSTDWSRLRKRVKR